MVKTLIVGDTHFGMRGGNETFLNISYQFVDFLKKVILDNDVQRVIVLGDVFDSRVSIIVKVISIVNSLFKFLEDRNIETYVILGNHDIYYRKNKTVTSLEMLENFSNVRVIRGIEEHTIDGEKCIFVPWLTNQEENDKLIDTLKNNTYTFCFSHLPIQTLRMNETQKEYAGFEPDIMKSVTRVYNGHFHVRQELGNILCIGSPFQITWNDYNNKKGVYIIDFETKQEKFIENVDSPCHVKVNYPDYTDDDILLTKNAFVRVYINELKEWKDVQKVLEKIELCHPLSLNIINQYENMDEDIQSNESLENIIDVIGDYIEQKKFTDNIDKGELLNRIKTIYNKVTKIE